MTRGESHSGKKGRRHHGERLWNATAVGGLLLVGLLLGGVAGVVLERHGLLGTPAEKPTITATAPISQTPAPRALPRVVAAAPEIDREALEARYHDALRQQEEPSPPETAMLPPALPAPQGLPAWQRHAVAVAPPEGRPMIAI
ncbi:MAG TPA: hypothetical protein VKP12_03770, partial [Kiloniellaceae bacterium]|nr:hypothetical protein [Kiloniellaceae bacterium]